MMTKPLNTRHGPMTLRTIRADEAAALRSLRLEALSNHLTTFGSAPEEIDSMNWSEQTATGDGAGHQAIFVVEREGELVAMAGVLGSTRVKMKHATFIWGVYVNPKYRGDRLAEALVNACVEWARAKGVSIVRLTVVVDNHKAIACYERCGFEITGREVASIRWENADYDEYLMFRRT